MFREADLKSGKDYAAGKKARLGVILFFVYLTIYAGFVLIGTFAPKFMGVNIITDLNLAFVYGMGLIVLAIVMGLVYNHFCKKYENEMKGVDNAL